MKILKLTKRPKSPLILEGFPGFGLVGTITTEYLINHLKTEVIGKFWFEEMPAAVAIHAGKLIPPIELHYNPEYNIIIVHALSAPVGIEWKMSDLIMQLADELKATEIISLEGIGGTSGKGKTFFYTTNAKKKEKMAEFCEPVKESVILGVTGALLLKEKQVPISAFFVETPSNLPDSRAAAKMIEVLDKYLGLKIDPKPLLKTAQEFESKIKSILEQNKDVTKQRDTRVQDYFG